VAERGERWPPVKSAHAPAPRNARAATSPTAQPQSQNPRNAALPKRP
jgi:hypothetical protein